MFRYLSLPLCAAALLPFAAYSETVPAPPSAVPLAAKIDGTLEVTVAEVDALAAAMLRAQGVPDEQQASMASAVREQAIDQMVTQKLLLRAADAAKLAVSGAEIDEFFKTRLPPNVSIAQVAEKEGITEDKLRTQVETNLRINKLLDGQLAAAPAATDDDLKALFDELSQRRPDFAETPEQVEARHILIKVEKDASEADRAKARAKLDGIRKQITDGGDFAKLAAENSDCPSGKQAGGSLGTFGRGQMVKPFEDAAFSQELNAVGEVISTDFGFHIVQVLKKLPAGKRTVESERAQLSEMVARRKKGELVSAHIQKLKDAAKIEILEKPVPPPPAESAPARELPVWAK